MAFDRRETAILLVGDFLILIASLWMALFLRNLAIPSISYLEANIVPFLPIFVVSLVVFYISGLYEKQTRPIRRIMSTRILWAQLATVTIAAIFFFVLPLSIAPKTILVLYLVVSVAAASAWRFYRMNREVKETDKVNAILVGSGAAVKELFDEVNGNSRYLIHFVSHIDTTDLEAGAVYHALVKRVAVDPQMLVVDTSDSIVIREGPALFEMVGNGTIFLEFASLYEEIFDRVPLDHLDARKLLEALPRNYVLYDWTKRLFDIGLALVGMVIAIPIVIIFALVLYVEGRRPFIRQERVGKGEKIIHLLKLRTMLFYDSGDPEKQKQNHVTRIGRFLRATRIDELPQLWNVLMGDLSFIGPRPELPRIAEVYEREIPQYRMRHLIAPGLSGWAQILDYDAPRGGADVVRTKRKVSYDLYYLKHRSFGLDMAIALKTLRALASFSGT